MYQDIRLCKFYALENFLSAVISQICWDFKTQFYRQNYCKNVIITIEKFIRKCTEICDLLYLSRIIRYISMLVIRYGYCKKFKDSGI